MTSADSDEISVFTIGYGGQPIDRIVALLKQHSIDVLVDVRSVPYSRARPEFRKKELAEIMRENSIEYLFLGDRLGGIPDSGTDYTTIRTGGPFQSGIDEVVDLTQTQLLCLLCAEENPARCHRFHLITPELTRRGFEVLHILPNGRAVPDAEIRKALNNNQIDLL